ncbi:MAG TPA: CopG family transcriptional regulator [Desulfobulbus sp.]|nr:CopG family transcriptional regulator [Desulfobulbus sp.]
MATTVKTAISIQKELFQEVNRLAEELHVSRSKLFVLAVRDFIKKNENKKIISQINKAFDDYPDSTEENLHNAMRQKQAGTIEREPW